jgi:hypothetical protein
MRKKHLILPRLFALGLLYWNAPRALADSATTTISAEDDALSRSESAESLAPGMPSGPPALSGVGAPVLRTGVAPKAAWVPAASAAAAAPVSSRSASPPSSAHVSIMDTRDATGKVIVTRGGEPPVVPGGGSIVDDRNGRGLEIVPVEPGSAPAPSAATPAAPSPAPALAPAASGGAEHENASRRRRSWQLILGGAAAVFVLGFALL